MPISFKFWPWASKESLASAELSGAEDDLALDTSEAPVHPSEGPASSGWFWSATIAVSLVVLVVGVAGVKSWSDLKISEERATELKQDLAKVDASVDRLKQRIHLLQSDSELLERVAREELGVVHPDEVVVILPDK